MVALEEECLRQYIKSSVAAIGLLFAAHISAIRPIVRQGRQPSQCQTSGPNQPVAAASRIRAQQSCLPPIARCQ
ncbi:MAG: hypothetical protein PHN61_03295 [Methanothrix sp.]|nr:hypothetical protein [Methanothrix sp.]